MKINTREHTIVELPSTKGDVCFREKFFSMLDQKKNWEEKKKQNTDNEHTYIHIYSHTADHQIYIYV